MTLPWHFLDTSLTLPWLFLDTSLTLPWHFLNKSSTLSDHFLNLSQHFLSNVWTHSQLSLDPSLTLPQNNLDTFTLFFKFLWHFHDASLTFFDTSTMLPWHFFDTFLLLKTISIPSQHFRQHFCQVSTLFQHTSNTFSVSESGRIWNYYFAPK